MRVYLDNAATTWPKPDVVNEAIAQYLTESGVAYGRGSSHRAAELRRVLDRCRRQIAELFQTRSTGSVVFTASGTDSLNMAIRGLLKRGDHVVCTTLEHNSVLRPLAALEEQGIVELTRVPCPSGFVEPNAIRDLITRQTALVCCVHASNVTGAIQPVTAIGEIVRDSNAAFLVDAAQTAGALPIHAGEMHADIIACPGHKGLLGPLGTGVLWLSRGIADRIEPLRYGGTGSFSEQESMPTAVPERFEAGNHNIPGLVGLAAGVAWVSERGVEAIRATEQQRTTELVEGLRSIDGIELQSPTEPNKRIGIVSWTHHSLPADVIGGILDDSFDIQSRTGLHCAPGVHREFGTLEAGGTVRLSVGPFTSRQDVQTAINAIRSIVEEMS